ncbi:fibronectin type III domain-containing protein [Myxococcus sp. NMCA1]|uniref:fibronectin type III domain-containing protein n=1 Tax=Myxococcus sp. NMCA1 TaxID=2996785 RepID=UPI002286862F|nr:fibronectin type III domain-containing protein [Myxococcus sp. NMCA1]WAM23760.1 fibronectin type III domain-containing protein [Myxococcus sp. NMCA1]
MNGRICLLAAVLLGLFGGMGCGGSDDPPPQGPQVTVPGAPTQVAAVAGDSQVTVAWAAPANNGGSAILEYAVHVFSGEREVRVVPSPAFANQALISDLTNGTAYAFSVVAVNDRGRGAASTRTALVTPHVTPGAVSNLVAVPGNQEVVLTWEAADGKGMALTGYSITVQAEDAGAESQPVTVTVTETRATLVALTNGTAYSFTVVADNGHAQGPGSSVSATPFTTPGAPALTARGYSTRVSLRWTTEDTGGRPITGYLVTVYLNDEVLRTVETTELTLNVTGLLYSTTYHFTVVARNEAGWGTISERIASTLARSPSVPLNATCDTSSGNVTFAWEPPEFDYGYPVVEYRIATMLRGYYTAWYTTKLRYVLPEIPREGNPMRFSLVAQNAYGFGNSVEIYCYFDSLRP